jgi:glycosyltransferase involved in cell wall biosynthesis
VSATISCAHPAAPATPAYFPSATSAAPAAGGRINRIREQGRRVVLYAGAMGPPNAMEVVVDAAAALAATNPEVHFVLIGSGISRAQLERRAANLPNVEFHNEVERPIVHAILRASDCAVVSFHENALYRHGISPNKIFDYGLFAPRTVIACEQNVLIGFVFRSWGKRPPVAGTAADIARTRRANTVDGIAGNPSIARAIILVASFGLVGRLHRRYNLARCDLGALRRPSN